MKIELTVDEVNKIIDMLAGLPFKDVSPVARFFESKFNQVIAANEAAGKVQKGLKSVEEG